VRNERWKCLQTKNKEEYRFYHSPFDSSDNLVERHTNPNIFAELESELQGFNEFLSTQTFDDAIDDLVRNSGQHSDTVEQNLRDLGYIE
jgi:hypothetical protein